MYFILMKIQEDEYSFTVFQKTKPIGTGLK